MAKKSLIVKTERRLARKAKAHSAGTKEKFPARAYNRCKNCGRNHGYIRFFQICRICFRQLAHAGKIMGVKKSSW